MALSEPARARATVSIAAVTERDWRQVRDLRLQALADTPHAFMETLVHAVARTDEHWKARARRCEGPDYVGFAAIDGSRWVGTMRGEISAEGQANLLGVFVLPSYRGRKHGIGDRLLDAVEQWMRDAGRSEVFLEVHQDNLRAQAFYQRRGYQFTGVSRPYPLLPAESEVQMRRAL